MPWIPRIVRQWLAPAFCLLAMSSCCELGITTESLPSGKVGEWYSVQLEAECYDGRWEFVSGDLPPGLSFSEDGELAGTPTTAGTFSFTVGVGGQGAENTSFVTKGFSVFVVQPVGNLEVTTQTTGSGLDPDGYTINVGSAQYDIGINETLAIPAIPVGDVMVTLTRVAVNCGVQGDNPRSLVIGEGTITRTTFVVDCTAP